MSSDSVSREGLESAREVAMACADAVVSALTFFRRSDSQGETEAELDGEAWFNVEQLCLAVQEADRVERVEKHLRGSKPVPLGREWATSAHALAVTLARKVLNSQSEAVRKVALKCIEDELSRLAALEGASDSAELRKKMTRMFQLDVDMSEFVAIARTSDDHVWVERAGFGRLLCGATLFEDAVKIITTTNTTWNQTKRMVQLLVEKCGRPDEETGMETYNFVYHMSDGGTVNVTATHLNSIDAVKYVLSQR